MSLREELEELKARVDELEERLEEYEAAPDPDEPEEPGLTAETISAIREVRDILLKQGTEFANYRNEFRNKLTDVDSRMGMLKNQMSGLATEVMRPVIGMNAAAEKVERGSAMLTSHLNVRGKIARSVRGWRDPQETASWMSKMNTLADAIEKPGFGEDT